MDATHDGQLICGVCGQPLQGDPDDVPGRADGGPICGECVRARDFDALLWEEEASVDDQDEELV